MSANVEALLREALTPVEPPVRMAEQLESSLTLLAEAAQEELDSWESAADTVEHIARDGVDAAVQWCHSLP